MGCTPTPLEPTVSFETNRTVANTAAVTDRVVIRFDGFTPGAEVTVRARMADGAESFATFTADEAGSFDTARIPVAGSYNGADADGLFWSMRGARNPQIVTTGALHVLVTAEVRDIEVAQARLERYATPELIPLAPQDLCAGVPCPEHAPILPQDPVPLEAP